MCCILYGSQNCYSFFFFSSFSFSYSYFVDTRSLSESLRSWLYEVLVSREESTVSVVVGAVVAAVVVVVVV